MKSTVYCLFALGLVGIVLYLLFHQKGSYRFKKASTASNGAKANRERTQAELGDLFTEQIVAPSVVIYTKRRCPYCRLAKELFEKESMPFQAIDITDDPAQHALLKQQTGQTTVPYIFIDQKFIGGYSDLLIFKQNKETLP